MFELNNFDSIQIGVASPEKNQGMVLRRGYQTGDDKLQDAKAREGRAFLRKDIRPYKGLGMPLRQIQEDTL